MANGKKLSRKDVAQYLKEALEPFCDKTDIRPALAAPFRQEGCIYATNGKVLLCIKSKEADCSVSPFRKDGLDVTSVMPVVDFEHLLRSRTVRRKDLKLAIERMQKAENRRPVLAVADFGGVKLDINGLSFIEVAMRICGAEAGRLVWNERFKVMLHFTNAKGQEAVTILLLGCNPEEYQIVSLPIAYYKEGDPVCIDWQRGMEEWAGIKSDMERKEEEERMARRKVFMVEVVKARHIPVYARNADEALRLCNSVIWVDQDDDWDSEWQLGDTVPEVMDLEYIKDRYNHFITRDGVVSRDKIQELDRISEEWHKKHDKE